VVEKFDTDVFVIGGGPAGLAAAIAARRKGFRVALADGTKPPIDKACGEGLMPDALEATRLLGISMPAIEGAYFRGIRFLGNGGSVAADFPTGTGYGLRRPVLHRILVEEAESSGVELQWDTAVTALEGNRVQFRRGSVTAQWIVGADGGQSRVRKWIGLDSGARVSSRFGFSRHYQIAPWTDYVEVYWGRGFQIYVTPVAVNEVCVALISRDPHRRLEQALPEFPGLQLRLDGAVVSVSDRGGLSVSRRLRAVYRGAVALIGDASGSVDAVTGEGICLAFRQARAWADAVERGDLSQYQAAHRTILQRHRLMSALLLSLDRWPALRRRVLRAFSARPELFSRMLATHVGATGLTDIAAAGLALGVEIL
jgi:flavin-dependent dehydrogenase